MTALVSFLYSAGVRAVTWEAKLALKPKVHKGKEHIRREGKSPSVLNIRVLYMNLLLFVNAFKYLCVARCECAIAEGKESL